MANCDWMRRRYRRFESAKNEYGDNPAAGNYSSGSRDYIAISILLPPPLQGVLFKAFSSSLVSQPPPQTFGFLPKGLFFRLHAVWGAPQPRSKIVCGDVWSMQSRQQRREDFYGITDRSRDHIVRTNYYRDQLSHLCKVLSFDPETLRYLYFS